MTSSARVQSRRWRALTVSVLLTRHPAMCLITRGSTAQARGGSLSSEHFRPRWGNGCVRGCTPRSETGDTYLGVHGGVLPAFALPKAFGLPAFQQLAPEALLGVKPTRDHAWT